MYGLSQSSGLLQVMYPYYVASGQGLIIVKQYSFIFERFRSPCYFFGVLYLVRNHGFEASKQAK